MASTVESNISVVSTHPPPSETIPETPIESHSNTKLTAALIFNPISGVSCDVDGIIQTIKSELELVYTLQITFTLPTKSATEIASEYLNAKHPPDVIIAAGGDGTISEIVSSICRFNDENTDANRKVPTLGIIPRGSGNALALALGIPRDLIGACRLLTTSPISSRPLDAALVKYRVKEDERGEKECSKHWMLLAGIGHEAIMTKTASRELKRRVGMFAYAFGAFKALFDSSAKFRLSLEFEDVRDRLPGVSGASVEMDKVKIYNVNARGLVVSNVCPPTTVMAQGLGDAVFDDGRFEFVCFAPMSGWNAMTAFVEMLYSGLLNVRVFRRDVFGFRARTVRVTTVPPQEIVLDGEMVGHTPFEAQCLPNAVLCVTPSAKVQKKRIRQLRSLLQRGRGVLTIVLFSVVASKLFYGAKKVIKRAAGSSSRHHHGLSDAEEEMSELESLSDQSDDE
mmetsp:Transcript_3952/g.6915  ORF Transcript_3952/g.6915 Transcript_3952/m.6915 type:complete len:453 (-) Transcript_3952:3955-5313(-)